MADGLLDNLDLLMNRLQPSEEERRRQLRESALTFGIGALGARKGYLPQDLSRAGLLAVADYNQGLRDSGTDKLKRLAIAQQLAQWQAQQQQLQQEREGQTGLTQAMLAAMSGGNASPMAGMPSLAPTVANATMLEQRQQSAAQPKDPFTAQMERASVLEREAARLAAANPNHPALPKIMQAAQKTREDAIKFREKYGEPKVNARGQYVQFGDFGTPKETGVGAEPKFNTYNLGGKTLVKNAYAIPAEGMDLAHTPTQSEITGAARLRWEQEKEKEQAKAGGKPQWDTAAGMFVYPPTPDNPSGRVVAPEGYQKIDRPLTESQGKNSMYLGMMKSATANIDKLTGLSNSEIALARGDARYVPQFMQNLASPEKAQKYVQSSLQWTEAMLRITTGATAPPEEIVRTSKTFFPQVGDGPEVIAQKAAQRKRMEQLVAIASGKGAGQVENILGGGGGGWSVTEIK